MSAGTMKKILIVDDSLTMRRALSSQLSHAGYTELVEAANGIEALQHLAGVDLVIMDWNMPAMDGLTCVREIRKIPDKQNLPIIMCTTEGGRDSVIEAMANGVNDYIIKPVDQHVLLEKVRKILEGPRTSTPEVGKRTFSLTMEVNQIIDHVSNRLDEEGIENRNASKLVRYAILKLCKDSEPASVEAALQAIKKDIDTFKNA